MDTPIVIVIVVVVIAVVAIAGSTIGYVLFLKKKKQTTPTPANTTLKEENTAGTTATVMSSTHDVKEAIKASPAAHPQDDDAFSAPIAAAEGSIGSINKPQRKYARRALNPTSLLSDKLELGSEQEAMDLFDKYMQAGIVDNTNKGFYSNAVATLKQSVRRQKSTRTTGASPSSPLDQMFAVVIGEEGEKAHSKHTKADRRASIFNTLTRNGGTQRQKWHQPSPWSENDA